MNFIKTKRLTIRNIDKKDISKLCELLTDNEISKTYMIPSFNNEDEVMVLANKLINISNEENHFFYGIYFEEKLIGFVNDVDQKNKSIELGYVIEPSYQNRGFATETLSTMIYYLLDNKYDEVLAAAFSDNIASIKVMEKCGMKKDDREEDILYRNINHHCIYYIYSRS